MTTQKFKVNQLVALGDAPNASLYRVSEAHSSHAVLVAITRRARRIVHFYDDTESYVELATEEQIDSFLGDLRELIEDRTNELSTIVATERLVKDLSGRLKEEDNNEVNL